MEPSMEPSSGSEAPVDRKDPVEFARLLSESRRSLERGDYGQVLRTLEPLVAELPATTSQGGELQLLMATAWMGQGNSARAMACCHQLKRCSDAQLRAQARELLSVLEAPSLERPREWSITLPELSDVEAVQGRMSQMARRRRSTKPPPPPPPPVGPTRAPFGFVLVVVALTLVAMLLGGCVQVRSEIHFGAPGRLQLGYALQAEGTRATPWQRQFGDYLEGQGFQRAGGRRRALDQAPLQRWRSPVFPAPEALGRLAANLQQAARFGGLELPAPVLALEERNLLLGVRQRLEIQLDLRSLAGMHGLELAVDLDPVSLRAVRQADPLVPVPMAGRQVVRWPLQPGVLNTLELRCWRWSPLGLGALAVVVGLALVLALQTLRRSIVPPLPQLPA
jgi:hypothetical protein